MAENNRADRDQQLREPVSGSSPADASESSLPVLEGVSDQTGANEEAGVNGVALSARGFGGPFPANNKQEAILTSVAGRNPDANNNEIINRRAVENTIAQSEANREEEAIINQVLAGDTEAFAQLIERYKVAVFNLCARMLHNPTEAEDAAQEVFVRAYTQLHSYQSGRRFSTWILSIASHYCIDLLRRRKPSVDLDAIAFWKQSDLPEPEEKALTSETRDEVRDLLTKLPDKYRGVTVLRYWQDLSYDEIAEATGLSVATVKTRLFRARELLAKELEKQRQNGGQSDQDEPVRSRGRGLVKKNRTVNSNAK